MTSLKTADFDYELPQELIAQAPAEPRDSCRLLCLDRESGKTSHHYFYELVDLLSERDLLVVNKTRVMPARLIGKKAASASTGGASTEGTSTSAGGASAEVFLLNKREDLDSTGHIWECLVKPGRRLKRGSKVLFRPGGLLAADASEPILEAEVLEYVSGSRGGRLVRLTPLGGRTLDTAIHEVGNVPLPPYISSYHGDPEKYQTVYAMQEEHSAAAPTAGLHFTPELIERIRAKGVSWAEVELEVGIDTFRLVEEDDPRDHVIHTERYSVFPKTVEAVEQCRKRGGRVIAVGTTSVRSLESAWDAKSGSLKACQGAQTSLYLMPGSEFHVVDAMITNFHVPRSTLMMLVSAFAGREYIMAAYEEAIREKYRFLSFGDAMFMY